MPFTQIRELTQITDFFGLLLSVWFMFYLLARGHSNPLTLRMALVLFALSVYYFNSFFVDFLETPASITISTISVLVAITAIHNLTHQLLPQPIRHKQRPLAAGILLFALLAVLCLLFSPPQAYSGTDAHQFLPVGTRQVGVDLFDLAAALGIILNLSIILRTKSELLNLTFYAALFFGVSTIGFATLTILFGWSIPRFVSTFTILLAFISFGYSIARYQSLQDSSLSIQDFPLSTLFIFLIALVYSLVARQLQLPIILTALLVILAVTSHSAYDLFRALLLRSASRRESGMRRELRQVTRASEPDSLDAALRRGLAILCHNIDAISGFVALREGPLFRIHASYHSIPNGTVIDTAAYSQDELFQPPTGASAVWMRWAYAEDQPIALIGLGPRSGLRQYTETDLDWLDDVADHIGSMVHTHRLALQIGAPLPPASAPAASQVDSLMSTLALNPGKHLLKDVEEAFRNLNDFGTLGQSPLTLMLAAQGETHIERGKAVQQKLLRSLDGLRPQSVGPPDPVPRQWFPYLILHGAYVEDIPDREIMSRLYISEGTFYRTRRKAMRSLTRAIIESAAQE